jgi:hypothetical protein
MKMSASRVPGIFGKMTNSGDKALDEVQFTVTYYQGKGKNKKAVLTEIHTPVATALEFTNFGHPVQPFVPGETRNFGFRLTAPTDVQMKSSPDLTVTSIVFTQSAAPLPKPVAPSPTPAASPAAGAAAAAPSADVRRIGDQAHNRDPDSQSRGDAARDLGQCRGARDSPGCRRRLHRCRQRFD